MDEAKLTFERANEHWSLVERSGSAAEGSWMYGFQRAPVFDAAGTPVEPYFAFIIHDLGDQPVDAHTYSLNMRGVLYFEVDQVLLAKDGLFRLTNAIGYRGRRNQDDGYEHTLLIVHAVYRNRGITSVADSTTDVFEQVRGEFENMLRSVRHTGPP